MELDTPHGTILVDPPYDHLLLERTVKVVLGPSGRPTHVRVSGKALHELVLTPRPPLQVDHVDRNPLNNTLANLRHATRTQQMQNRRGWSANGYKGVVWIPPRLGKGRGKYEARITLSGKKTYLGRSDDPETCARLYDQAAKEHFGDFASLNFPSEVS